MISKLFFGRNIHHQVLKEPFILSLASLEIPPKKDIFWVRDGEKAKTRSEKKRIEDWLLKKGCDKRSKLVAIGGGALLDVVGFVAATFFRGIPYISVPTTLLAMTDAAIGGKVAINVGKAKNALGTFYQPESIYIDVSFLETLSDKEFLNGMSEVIKHSLIASPSFFSFLKTKWKQILAKEETVLLDMLKQSIDIKKNIVEQDPFDTGIRRVLNFGHTIGHALEAGSEYCIAHGEAVRLGMIGESYLALKMGIMEKGCFNEIYEILRRFKTSFSFDVGKVKKALLFDKKNLKGKNRFVILSDIGKPLSFSEEYVTNVSDPLIEEALQFTLRHH